MLWGCVASTGTADLVKVEGHMNSSQYQQILDKNVQESVTKLSYARVGFFSRTMIQSTVQNPPRNWCRSTSTIFWNGHQSPQTLTSLKMCGLIWSRLSTHGSQETWLNWRHCVWRNGPKYHLPDFRDLSVAIGGVYRLFLQQKEAQLNINGIMSMGCPNLCTCLFLFICTQKCFFWTNKNDFTTEMFLFS